MVAWRALTLTSTNQSDLYVLGNLYQKTNTAHGKIIRFGKRRIIFRSQLKVRLNMKTVLKLSKDVKIQLLLLEDARTWLFKLVNTRSNSSVFLNQRELTQLVSKVPALNRMEQVAKSMYNDLTQTNAPTDLCRICFQEARTILHLPCFHFSACEKCNDQLFHMFPSPTCVICRENLQSWVRIYPA